MKFCLFLVFVLFAASVFAEGRPIGPGVSVLDGKELKWENGSHDYFVMFKSSITYEGTSLDKKNPQANTCLSSSTFEMKPEYIPEDAYVEAAYLVWMNTTEPDGGLHVPVPNSVGLEFKNNDSTIVQSANIVASRDGTSGDGPHDFTFEGVNCGVATGYYTYRVDVTDFFKEIHKKGDSAELQKDAEALIGNYTVSGIPCSAYVEYKTVAMSGGWSIILIYKSEKVTPKRIYLYNGFSDYLDSETEIPITDFYLPIDPLIRMTLMTGEGDPDLVNMSQKPEGLFIKGEQANDFVPVYDDCNPRMKKDEWGKILEYTEIYSSISNIIPWNSDTPVCLGGTPGAFDLSTMEYGIDVDTFVINPSNEKYKGQLNFEDTSLTLKVSANYDRIVTNYLIVSVDTKTPSFDIPGKREKDFCSCSKNKDYFCKEQPFYYFIRVQNWGKDIAKNVTFKDVLPPEVKYIAGTTEIGRKKSTDTKMVWEKVADKNGEFPFTAGGSVESEMKPCIKEPCDTAFIRFQVQPVAGLDKSAVIKNEGVLEGTDVASYRTNNGVALRLRLDSSCDSSCTPDRCSESCGGCGNEPDPVVDNDTVNPTSDSDTTLVDSDSKTENDSSNPSNSADSDVVNIVTDETGCGCSVI